MQMKQRLLDELRGRRSKTEAEVKLEEDEHAEMRMEQDRARGIVATPGVFPRLTSPPTGGLSPYTHKTKAGRYLLMYRPRRWMRGFLYMLSVKVSFERY